MTTESRAPQASDWADVVEALHGALNTVIVRGQYPAGHPAVRRADEQAAVGFARVFKKVSELVVALIDEEFVVSERPRPELRERLPGLAEVMTRHAVECIVFQQGMTTAECSTFGEIFSGLPDPNDPARARDQAQARLAHILLRFAELKSQDAARGKGGAGDYLVPSVHAALLEIARATEKGGTIDRRAVVSVAELIQAQSAIRAFSLEPRAYAPGTSDMATHATNVAMMTAAMAHEAGFPEAVRLEVTAAALVHDAGRLLLPAPIRGVPEPLLDAKARKQYQYHPFLGARALLAGGCPTLWVAVALEHHRGVDGGGYPAFGPATAPHELVRIVSLANYVDAKRAALPGKVELPVDVLRAASALERRYFDRKTLGLFLRTFGLFPPGTSVELSDRQSAIVTRANPGNPFRPEVTILHGPSAGKHIDLKALNAVERKHALSIVRAILPPLALRSENAKEDVKTVVPASEPPGRVSYPELGGIFTGVNVLSLPPDAASTPTRPPDPRDPPVAITPTRPPAPQAVVAPSRPPVAQGAPPPATPGASSRPSSPSGPRQVAPSSKISSPPAGSPPVDLAKALHRVPKLVLTPGAIMKLPLDPRAGFLLSFIDGTSTLEAIVDGSGLRQEEVLRIVLDLLGHGAVKLT